MFWVKRALHRFAGARCIVHIPGSAVPAGAAAARSFK
jgi:hypothetical protein